MYTMKIVLFHILFICAIAGIFATWSPETLVERIGSIRTKLAEEEAKQDILSLLNSNEEDGSKPLSLNDLPIEKIIKADISRQPKFEKAKKIKSKPKESLQVLPLDDLNNFYSDFNAKYPKKFLTPSYIAEDGPVSEEMFPNSKNVDADSSESEEMLFVIRLPPNYLKEQQNKLYTDNIPPLVDGLSVEDITVLEIPPENSKESKSYYQKHNPKKNYYPKKHANGYYNNKPKILPWKKQLLHLLKRITYQSRLKKQINQSKDPYRIGNEVVEKFQNIVKEKTMTYYDKLKVYLQNFVAKILNRAIKKKEQEEKGRRGIYRSRFKRETQAGYTQDPDTCKKYNENLEKMWETLSKYLNSTDPVNEQALHNIAVMVEAYIAHQNERPHVEEVEYHPEKKKDKISEVLKKIKKLLNEDDATEKVKEMVLENFQPEYDDSSDCKQINEDNLFSSIDLSYRNYLDNAQCHGDYDTGLLRGKALLRNRAPVKTKDLSGRQYHDSYVVHKSILNEAEKSEDFNKGRMPANKRPKKRGKFNRRINKRSLDRSVRLYRDARRPKKRPSGLRRRPKKGSKTNKKRSRPKKSHIRSDESCVKYANRKFLITLRTSIERFMALRDCQRDDTLRTSNNDNKTVTRRRKPALRTSNERKFNDMTFYTDTEIGENEQRHINDYLSKVKDFNDQDPIKRNKSIFVVHTSSYKSPLLLKLNNKREGMHSYMKRPLEQPSYYNMPSKYSFDTIYKSFLESSDKGSFNTLHTKKSAGGPLQSKHKPGGIYDINLYDIIKQKVDQEKKKHPFSTVVRQNDDGNETLDVEHNNNSSSDDVTATNANLTEEGTSVNFEEIGHMLDDVRNSTLQKPQIDTKSFASDSNKGYVELSYLVKYPKSIVFRPQYLVKNILQYEDFVKIASQLYMTDDDKQLMKIVRYLPDNRTQLLFETQDFKSPIEVYDIKEDIKKNKPIFSANFSGSNEALRQRTPNETDEYNPDNENENRADINSLLQDRISADSPLRESMIDSANSHLEDNFSTDLNLADAEKINMEINNTDLLREDYINTDITRAETLSEDPIHTDLNNEDSLQQSRISTDVNRTGFVREDNISKYDKRDELPLEDIINTEINDEIFRDSKISPSIDHANPVEILPEEKIDTEVYNTDYLREKINNNENHIALLRDDNFSNHEGDRPPEDIINRDLNNENSLRESKNSTDVNQVHTLRDDDNISTGIVNTDLVLEDIINEKPDFLRESKNSIHVIRADTPRDDNISTGVNNADFVLEDITNGESDNVDSLRESKNSTDVNRVNTLSDDNINIIVDNPDFVIEAITNGEPAIVDSLRESKNSSDVNRVDTLRDDNISIIDDNSDFVIEDITNGELAIVDSLRESKNNTEVDHIDILRDDKISIIVDNPEFVIEAITNEEPAIVDSLRESENSTDVNRVDTLRDDNISIIDDNSDFVIEDITNGESAIVDSLRESKNSTEVDHIDILRDDKISIIVDNPGFVLEDITDREPAIVDSLRESKNSTDIDRVDTLRDDKISIIVENPEFVIEAITNGEPAIVDSLRENKNSTDVNRVDTLRDDNISVIDDNSDFVIDDITNGEPAIIDTLREGKNSTDVNRVDTLSDDNISIIVDHPDFVIEDITNGESTIIDSLRGSENNTDVNRVDTLRDHNISTSLNKADFVLEYGKPGNLDNLRESNFNANVEHADQLTEDKITADLDVNREEALPKDITYVEIKKEDSLQKSELATRFNKADFLAEDNISTDVNQAYPAQEDNINADYDNEYLQAVEKMNIDLSDIDLLRQKKISTVGYHVDLLENTNFNKDGQLNDEINSAVVKEQPLLEDNFKMDISEINPSQEGKINTDDNRSDSLLEINTEENNAESLRESIIDIDVDRVDPLSIDNINTEDNDSGILLDEKISSEVSNVGTLRESKISTEVNSLIEDIISTEVNHADPQPEDNIKSKIDQMVALREDKINTDVNLEDSLQEYKHSVEDNKNQPHEDKMSLYLSILDTLQNSKIPDVGRVDYIPETNFNTEDVDLQREDVVSSDRNHADAFFKDVSNLDDDDAKSLRKIKMSTDVDNADSLQEDNSNTDVHRAEPLPENEIITENNNANFLQETNHDIDHVELLRQNDISTEVSRVDHFPVIKTDTVDNSNYLRERKLNATDCPTNPLRENDIDNDSLDAKSLLDEIDMGENNADSLKDDKINYDVDHVDLLRQNNVSTEVHRADSLLEDKTNLEVDNADYLRDIKISSTDFPVEHLQEYNVNNNAQRAEPLPEDKKIIEETKAEPVKEDVIDSDDLLRHNNINIEVNHTDKLPKNNTNTEEDNVNYLRESKISSTECPVEDNINTELNRENVIPEQEKDHTDSIRESKVILDFEQKNNISSEITRSDPLPDDKIHTETDDINSLRDSKINSEVHGDHADILQNDNISTDGNREEPSIEDNHSAEIYDISETDPLRNSILDMLTNMNHAGRMHENVIKPEDKISTEDNDADLTHEEIASIDENLAAADPLRKGKTSAGVNRSDLLSENIIDKEVADPLREGNIKTDVHRNEPLLEEKHSVEVNSNEYLHPEENVDMVDPLPNSKIDTDNNHEDHLREGYIQPEISLPDHLPKDRMTTESNHADYLQKEIIKTDYNRADPLREDKQRQNNNQSDPFLEDKIYTAVNHADLMQDKTSSEVDGLDPVLKSYVSTDVNREDSLPEDKTDTIYKNSIQKDKITSEVNGVDSLRKGDIDSDVYRADNLPKDKSTLEFNNVNILRGSNTSTDDNRAELLPDDKNNPDESHENLMQKDEISSEVNSADSLQKYDIDSDVDRADNLPKDKSALEFNNVNILRGSNTSTDDNRAELLPDNKNNPDESHENLMQKHEISSEVNSADSLQKYDIDSDVDRAANLPKDKSTLEFNNVNILRGSNTSTDGNLAELLPDDKNNPDESHENLMQKDEISSEVNSADSLQKYDTDSDVDRADNLPKDKSTLEFNNVNILRESNTSTDGNRAELLPDDKNNPDESHENLMQKDEISSEVNSADSLQKYDTDSDIDRADNLPKDKSTLEFNNVNILRENNTSTDDNRADPLPHDKVSLDVSQENPIQEDNRSSETNSGVLLRGGNISNDVNNVVLLPENKVNIETSHEDLMEEEKNNSEINRGDTLREGEIITDVNNENPSPVDNISINISKVESQRKGKIDTEINEFTKARDIINAVFSPVTVLQNKGAINDNAEIPREDEVNFDHYRVNPLSDSKIRTAIENKHLLPEETIHANVKNDASHVDLSPDDKINTDFRQEDTLPEEEKNTNADRMDSLQEDTTNIEANRKDTLRESIIDINVKDADSLSIDTDADNNRNPLQEDQISTSISRVDPHLEDKIEELDLNIDANKEPRNYTEDVDYLTYQDGYIDEGLNASSNEFVRQWSSDEPPNPVLNETSYKYNASSALRESFIDTFNDTLNSSEFINRKDDLDLSELNNNISLPDIDAESISDYLRFTLNNAEASLSTASHAYLKELETQGMSSAAATKVMLKHWWETWKNKLTAKVQSIAGRVTNLFKKLENVTSSNEAVELEDETSDI